MNDMEILELIGVPYFKKGKGIHIKKKNRGKFTEYCGGKVTDECIKRAKKSKNPKLRKRATFAANARKWKHAEGGIIKAQQGTMFLTPHPLSTVGIALNQAKANAKNKKDQTHLPPGVKEVIGPDGKKIAIRTEQPLKPLEQDMAEWLPGTGDIAEFGYVTNDLKQGRYGTAMVGAGLLLIPGAFGKFLNKYRKTVRTADNIEDAVRKANTAGYINNIDDTFIDPVHLERVAKSEQIDRFNAFARTYGYPEITDVNISNAQLDELTKSMLERHNTYFRGVQVTPEVEDLAKQLNITKDEALKIAATTPRHGESHIFVSPTNNAGIYGAGTAAKIRRPYKLGQDRTKWFNEANFQIEVPHYYGGNPNAEVIYPWFSRSTRETSVPNELLLKKGQFINWEKGNLEGLGSNNRIFTAFDDFGNVEVLPLKKFTTGGKLNKRKKQ